MTAMPQAALRPSAPAQTAPANGAVQARPRLLTALAVWAARLFVGGVFVVSGMVKAVDLWGTIFKIEEYLQAWGWADAVPRALVVMGSALLCIFEFLAGAMLLLGCYRRSAPRLLMLFTVVMAALTLWVWIADPVADCGCFGDFIRLSNAATFWKNIVLAAVLAWPLWRLNARVAGVFRPYFQWMAAAVCTLLVLAVAVTGYASQPLLDFRRFAEGTSLLEGADDDDDDAQTDGPVYEFIYADASGKLSAHTLDALPAADSGLTFVERRLVSGSEQASDGFVLADTDGEDITADVIDDTADQMLIAIANPLAVNPGQTYAINELSSYMASRGGSLVALLAPVEGWQEYWDDMAMADYPVYTLEPTVIKELVRGRVGVVYLRGGKVLWKTSLSGRMVDDFTPGKGDAELPDYFEQSGTDDFWTLVGAAVVLLLIVLLLDRTGAGAQALWRRACRRKAKSTDNQQTTNNTNQ